MKIRNSDFIVVKNTPAGDRSFLLELHLNEPLPEIAPGQFCEVLIENSPQTFLRRPFSIHNVLHDKNNIVLFVGIAGAGTLQLSKLNTGAKVNLLYPLGRGFTIPQSGRVLLAGGGCGMAPLLYLAHQLHERNIRIDILAGGKCITDIPETEAFRKYGNVYITTEDGSAGEQGIITGHSLLNEHNHYDRTYCCGPEPMMKAMARWSAVHDTECEVSLENSMACGIGACLCCVTPTVNGHQCVCTDGPVFNTKTLLWQT